MKKISGKTGLSIALLLAAIWFTGCKAPSTVGYYDGKWEKEIAAFDGLNKTETYPENSILFTGSSSIRLWTTLRKEMAPYPVIQRGFGGSNSASVAYYMKRIAYPHKLRAIVIFVANDITGSANDLAPTESLLNFKSMVKTLRVKFKKQPIYLVEITPTQSRWKYWSNIKLTNVLLKDYCSKNRNLYFIETAKSYLNEKGEPNNDLFRDDYLHLNHQGYLIWGKLIKDKLDATLK
ncbi:MAG: GDSL-type esterase/lipase family protein [Marinilabiliales bacterium]|nr:GDSL-type esterase/lipase family protein [Marinilabiliales bacterium]